MASIEKEFGKAVRHFRNKTGLSQEAFAGKAGVHRTYISSIELGKVKVSIGVAQKLVDALGISLSTFWKYVEKRV